MNINFNALLLIKPLWDWEKSIKQQKNNKNFLNNLDSCIFLFRPSTIDCFKSRGVWLSKKKKLIEEMSRVMYPSDDSRHPFDRIVHLLQFNRSVSLYFSLNCEAIKSMTLNTVLFWCIMPLSHSILFVFMKIILPNAQQHIV